MSTAEHLGLLPLHTLVDEHTGIIRRVRSVLTPENAPSSYTSMTAEVSDARWLGDWPADRVSLGTTFGDERQAWIAAVAEGMERYCGNFIPADVPDAEHFIGTARQAQAAGHRVVPLRELPRFAPWQLERPGFPYRNLAEDTETLWTSCRRHGDGEEVWLPASLVYLNWRQRRFAQLPRIHHLNYAGIATGQGFADARDRALLETVERDALELWWHLDGPTRGIRTDSIPGLAQAMEGCRLEYWVVEMPSEFAPAMAALVFDPDTGLYAAGFSCKSDPAEAARKAVLEAVHTWIYTQGATDADGWVFQAVEAGLMARGLYLEHRVDRRYLQDTGEHFEAVRDLGAHVQVWLDSRMHVLAERFRTPTGGLVDIEKVAAVPMEAVHRRLARAGHEVYTRELTTNDVALTGLSVVRVVVGGLVPNAPAAFAYLGCPRIADIAVARGWRDVPPYGPDDFTLAPPPHM
ncbi:YcaO-like family protein [Arthrobacter antibioticus]|uniref:YcaO-like family protein n=1 Tax=Arthrobacter sp. H35-MC1 TaxID=3046203 RepID=UPI0024B8E7A3|nr:YcaO-like family protein [Arthrobacter sp. H35-MC1]MDJ0318584.1 YcaO-like family protein [Arthrobacter sp. H35-MC1]